MTATPHVVRELLGRQLSNLREAKGLSQEAAGRHIAASASKISRLELGRVKVKDDDLAELLTLYGVNGAGERRAMFEIAWRANNRQWWHEYSDVLESWFCSYLVLEAAAEYIRTYEVQFIPGLLQTPAYAEAVIRLRFTDEAEIKRRVDVRMRRQEMLRETCGPHLWAVVDEVALHRKIGGPEVMREQIDVLIKANELPNVSIQILPLDSDGYAGTGNSFSLLRLPIKNISDVVYFEQIDSALYCTDYEANPYQMAMERLSQAARKPQETAAALRGVLATMNQNVESCGKP